MTVRANQDVDSALANKQRKEAIQDEQHDIASAEQLNAEPIEDIQPEQRELQDGEVDITNHKETSVDPRTQYANDLVKRQREERDKEIEEADAANGYKPEAEEPQELEEEFQEEFEQEQDPQFDNNADSDVDLDQPGFHGDTVTLKVDGQLVKMSQEQALSLLQKSQSADRRLEQASLKEREINERELALQQREQYQPPAPGVEKRNEAEVRQEVQTAFELLENGDTTEAVEHLTKVLSVQQPTATAEQVAAQVTQKLRTEQAASVESRLKRSGKYDDVFNDPTAYQLAVQNVQHLNKQRFGDSFEDVMVEAVEMVRDFRSGIPRKERLARSQDDKTNNRRQQKRNAQKPVKSSVSSPRKAVVKQQEPTEAQRRQSIFEQQKAARNQ